MPDKNINDLTDWEELWAKPHSQIFDEYEKIITPDEMHDIITNRHRDDPPVNFNYARNYAEPGPNNLVRHTVDNTHCIKHGHGTWDCIIGEFS